MEGGGLTGLTQGLQQLSRRIESDSLPAPVRDAAVRAVEDLGRRVTVGDVAARAGLNVAQAEGALRALATDAGGFLEVSDEGDVLYVFPWDVRAQLLSKSLSLKLQPVLASLKMGAEYVIRIAFGTTLLASIVLVFAAIAIILSSRSDDRDRRGNGGGGGLGFYVNPFDLFWYANPRYNAYGRSPYSNGRKQEMNFFQSVFSFVFGDGDPNDGREEVRWQEIGKHITRQGGVVTAEELAPFLDPPPAGQEDNESYMLPVLQRFDGHPEVDEVGNILYRFPSLQRTASGSGQSSSSSSSMYRWNKWSGSSTSQTGREGEETPSMSGVPYFQEKTWEFSKAPAGQRGLAVGLGVLNMVGVVFLSFLIRDPAVVRDVGANAVQLAASLMPFLQVYAASFLLIPAVRSLLLRRRNEAIDARNEIRSDRAVAVARPNVALRRKLANARKKSERTVLGSERIIYRTDRDVIDQDTEAADWEQRLKEGQPRSTPL